MVIEASSLPKVCDMICRIHRDGAFTEMPGQVDWKNNHGLIFVVCHIRDITMDMFPDLEQNVRTHIIHNSVETDKYCFNSIKEFGDMVLSNDYHSGACREYIEDNYSLTKQLHEIESLLDTCSNQNRPANLKGASGRVFKTE